MGISVSLILAAAGAVLAWAVNADVSGIEVQTIGFILLVVGIVGVLLSLVFWSSFGGFGERSRGAVVREREVL
jgi:beta-lactamase regulating signal transducer with metallopeptidase domain